MNTPDPDSPERISESDATRLWERAAELQAETLHRLEARARELRHSEAHDEVSDAPAHSGFALEEVREAAREAGIDPAFVDRALSELRSEHSTLAAPRDRVDGMADRLLNQPAGSVLATRMVEGEGAEVLSALDRLLTGPKHALTLVDADDRDPLHGGTLTFRIPSWQGLSGTDALAYRASWLWVKTLRATIRPLPSDEIPRWEIELLVPLRKGRRASAWTSALVAAVTGSVGGLGGAVTGALGLGMLGAGGAVLVPAGVLGGVLGMALGGGVGVGVSRWSWGHGARALKGTLEEILRQVHLQLRTGGAFGGPPAQPDDPSGMRTMERWLGGL